ncbi:palmitoyltransferase PFA4 [Armillaria borealis]|uniref:Palmitoyltransferase PFA4 n=1 Tax=Armillaria borealis TaxID=47425 RepID=A0AA39KA59_9AGAR|nr:palmitoyltransferase PFA4 [Armillaria borealis]
MHPSSFLGRLVVNLTLCLICFIAYSSQIFVIWPWYGRALSVDLICLLLPFNLLVGMLLWNYFLSVFTDPGGVPDGWKPDTHEDGYEVKKLTGGPRYCRVCEKYKPPRTHHCRQCKRCILRMDHHCPWINNCVGHFNYGYFIRFLFYVDVACSYHLVMMTRRAMESPTVVYWNTITATELVFIILNFVACVPVLLAVGAFSLFHFSSLMSNTTTIEGWEKDKVATMVRRGKIREIKFPYNLGRRRNIESVLGPSPLLWCYPVRTPGNGLKYDINESDEGLELDIWPPRDPAAALYEDRPEGFHLPDSPWTYGNETVNPDLKPSNSQPRKSSRRRTKNGHASTLPPYHPDYQEGASSGYDYEDDSSDESSPDEGHALVRRGSEGYEVRPQGREDMLHRYLQEIGETPGRYHRYIPQPDSESESDDDDIPIGQSLRTNDREQ